jgi:hypothetical protein
MPNSYPKLTPMKKTIYLILVGLVLVGSLMATYLWGISKFASVITIVAVIAIVVAERKFEILEGLLKLDNTEESVLSFCVAVGLGVIAVAIHMGAISYMEKTAPEKMRMIEAADSINLATARQLIAGTTPNHIRLKSQFELCQQLKDYYLDMGHTFFRNYYAFTTCSVFFAALLAIAAFLLVSKGWQNASLLIKTFFLMTIFISSFYFLLASVLNNRENYILNLKKVKAYNQVQFDILSFTAQPYAIRDDSLTSAVKRNYKVIAEYFDLQTIEIDADQLGGSPVEHLKAMQGKGN